MGLFWGVLGILIIASNRWFSYKWKVANVFHSVFGLGLTGLTLWQGILLIITQKEIQFNFHSILGALITSMIFLLALGGMITNYLKLKSSNTALLMKIKQGHG